MERQRFRNLIIVFLAGTLGSVVVGAAAFRMRMFDAGHPFFQCISIGALLAGVLALIRFDRMFQAIMVAVCFVLLNFLGHQTMLGGDTVTVVVWSLLLAGGVVLVGVIYDLLAREGYRLGKFLLLGPLMAGVYIAATPITILRDVSFGDTVTSLVLNCFLGIVIGDGVGLGAESAELLLGGKRDA